MHYILCGQTICWPLRALTSEDWSSQDQEDTFASGVWLKLAYLGPEFIGVVEIIQKLGGDHDADQTSVEGRRAMFQQQPLVKSPGARHTNIFSQQARRREEFAGIHYRKPK